MTRGRRRAARVWVALRTALARPPRAAYLCALVGLFNALAWSVLVPPFEVPDEDAHYAYVQQLVEAGSLPRYEPIYRGISPAEDQTLEVIHTFRIVGQPGNPAPLTSGDQQLLLHVEHEGLSAKGTGNAGSASDNPPLYYGVETIPFALSPSGTVLNRLALMRAVSALFAGFTVFFVFMFLRELFPGTRWVWPFGALAVAFQPVFAFISGGVNNDSLLYACAAALFFAIAWMFRRGLDERAGLAIGAALGLGLVAKFTLLGFAPGTALAILFGVRRAWPAARRAALRGAAVAAALAALPTLLYVALFRSTITSGGISAPAVAFSGGHTSLRTEIAYIWQLFLPKLPWQISHFPRSELWHEWFIGLVGRYGWLDTSFPFWVYIVIGPIALLILVAGVAGLAREWRRVWRRSGDLLVYVAMIAGLCIEIGVESYNEFASTGGTFEQPRYLLSGLCVYAAVVALVARLPGRRWGVAVGGLIVMAAFADNLFSQLLVVGRFYA